jgi:hypothetical protein
MQLENYTTQAVAIAALNTLPPMPNNYTAFLEKFAEVAQSPERVKQPSPVLVDWRNQASQTIKSPHDGFLQNYLARAPRVVPPSQTKAQPWQLPPTISRRESMAFRGSLASAYLREFVDEWLNTGRNRDGSESPGQRILEQAPGAYEALWNYVHQAPPRWSGSSDSSGFCLIIGEPSSYLGQPPDFFSAQSIEAGRLFTGIMASDWKDRLCKCRYGRCGRYFVHAMPRKSYRYGTFCSREHASLVVADVTMRRVRGEALTTLVEAAAQKLVRWKIRDSSWQTDRSLKGRLASELCSVILRKSLQTDQQVVRSNWVTRHQLRIELMRLDLAAKVTWQKQSSLEVKPQSVKKILREITGTSED